MSTSSTRVYVHTGVFLPVQTRTDDVGRAAVKSEWPSPRDNGRRAAKRPHPSNGHIADSGFILVEPLRTGLKGVHLLLVQSVSTGELFINKISERPVIAPLELRVSTASYKDNDGDHDPREQGKLPRDAKWCNQLRFWQKLNEVVPGNGPVYSLYFEYCNGGDLEDLKYAYINANTAIPEHFIWLVAEQLCLAVAWMYFGKRPDNPRSVQGYGLWTTIYHRDLWENNIFIHYPARPNSHIPGYGLESNAFPQVVIGDFGNSGMDGDPTDNESFLPVNVVPHGDDNARELREWEDIYSIGATLRGLCLSHIPEDVVRRADPDKSLASIAATHGPLPYSDRLVNLLSNFEWAGIDNGQEINDSNDPEAATVANAQWCLDTLLPAAQQEVEVRRNPPGGRPAGYFQGLDVSWTRRKDYMPFFYNANYTSEADPEPDQVDVDLDEINDNEERYVRWWMRKLRRLHRWDSVKPPYELRSLEWAAPKVALLNSSPP